MIMYLCNRSGSYVDLITKKKMQKLFTSGTDDITANLIKNNSIYYVNIFEIIVVEYSFFNSLLVFGQ